MTDRYNALTVVLERDIRDDDSESMINAIQMIKGVRSVTPHVANIDEHIAKERAMHDIRTRVIDVLYPKVKP